MASLWQLRMRGPCPVGMDEMIRHPRPMRRTDRVRTTSFGPDGKIGGKAHTPFRRSFPNTAALLARSLNPGPGQEDDPLSQPAPAQK